LRDLATHIGLARLTQLDLVDCQESRRWQHAGTGEQDEPDAQAHAA
jgi:hypothetical protein